MPLMPTHPPDLLAGPTGYLPPITCVTGNQVQSPRLAPDWNWICTGLLAVHLLTLAYVLQHRSAASVCVCVLRHVLDSTPTAQCSVPFGGMGYRLVTYLAQKGHARTHTPVAQDNANEARQVCVVGPPMQAARAFCCR